jgi:single-strand DNA-binding protein
MSINKVILVGNVGKDPVIRYFDKGVAKANFPLATSESYTNQQGETITSTEWHNIVIWRALAEVAEKTVKKGSQVHVVGKIKTRSYVDKDGNNKYITEILADTLLVLEKKQVAGTGPQTTDLNEPKPTYQTSQSGTETPKPYDKEGNTADYFSGESSNAATGINEDDLPF